MTCACDTKSKTLRKIKINGKWGYIDQCASLVIKPHYGEAFPFREGLAVVWDEPWGATGSPPPFSVINELGEKVITQSVQYTAEGYDLKAWSG